MENTITPNKINELHSSSLATLQLFHAAFLAQMPKEQNDQMEYVNYFITDLEAYVDFDDHTIDEIAEPVAKDLGIPFQSGWYLCFVDTYGSDEFMKNLEEPDVNIPLMGFVDGLFLTIKNLKHLRELLERGQDVLSAYEPNEGILWFTDYNERDLHLYEAMVYNDLLLSYADITTRPHKDVVLFSESELVEFNRLFQSGEENKGWTYLAQRLDMSEDEISEIYDARLDVITGNYQTTIFSFDREQRLNYAILLAVQKYMTFIRSEIAKPRLYDQYKNVKPVVDDRICLSDKAREYVQKCFNKLALDVNGHEKGKPVLQQEEIDYILASNFTGFAEGLPIPCKLFEAGLRAKKHIARFVFKVMEPLMNEEDCYVTLSRITRLIQENFIGFEDLSVDATQKYMRDNKTVMPDYLMNYILEQTRREGNIRRLVRK